MIDFKCRPTCGSYFFGFGERKNGLGDEGADGAMPHPHNFCARTAPGGISQNTSLLISI